MTCFLIIIPGIPSEEVKGVLDVLEDDEDEGSAVDQVAERDREEVRQEIDLLFHQIFPE